MKLTNNTIKLLVVATTLTLLLSVLAFVVRFSKQGTSIGIGNNTPTTTTEQIASVSKANLYPIDKNWITKQYSRSYKEGLNLGMTYQFELSIPKSWSISQSVYKYFDSGDSCKEFTISDPKKVLIIDLVETCTGEESAPIQINNVIEVSKISILAESGKVDLHIVRIKANDGYKYGRIVTREGANIDMNSDKIFPIIFYDPNWGVSFYISFKIVGNNVNQDLIETADTIISSLKIKQQLFTR